MPEAPANSSEDLHADLVHREEMLGHRPGDRVVRITRHRHFWGAADGALLPRSAATVPQGGLAKFFWRAKRFLIGNPIATVEDVNERLTKVKALAVLSSDALSSVAYSTEAIMRVLVLAGVAALALTLPISIAIALLLVIVATSYQQTIRAYPSGGGSYIVAHENLGIVPGLIAGAALMVGYILTVAVSVAAGVDALISAFPLLERYDMMLTIGAVVLITLMNLRGVRESGTIFAAPTYVFLVSILGMIGFGLFRLATGGIPYEPGPAGPVAGIESLTWFLVLSAFAKGCAAMTGTEAIANAVPAFQRPEPRNARITLGWMAVLLGVMFVGISFLVTRVGLIPDPTEHQTVLSELTRLVVGDSAYYYLVQFATTMILVLAANTSYTGFPWLLNVMARDGYVPRWFGLRGDRLVFSFGILVLSLLSGLLLVAFGSDVESLLPLYAIGVFTAFTLSQSGMVVHWLRGSEPNRRRSAVVNGVGAFATGVATLVIGVTKFTEGAWMVVVVVPAVMVLLLLVHHHYQSVAKQLDAHPPISPKGSRPLVVVPVSSLNLVGRQALSFARDLSDRLLAVHVSSDPDETERLRAQWQEAAGNIPLVIIESPYRLMIPPLLAYMDALRETHPNDTLLVVLPEFVPSHWWENLLHNQTALRLKAALLFRPGVVVASVPYQLGR